MFCVKRKLPNRDLITKRRISKRSQDAPERVLFGLMTHNTYESIKSFGIFCMQMFKVVMASLLSLFVPQVCPADPEHGFDTSHSCTDKENMGQTSPLTTFEFAVLIWNFITLGFALLHYILVLRREKFLIEYLDVDENLPVANLPHVVNQYPLIDTLLLKINILVFVSSLWLCALFVINAILSGIMIFRDYYDGFRSVTVFVTNMALMETVLETTLLHAYIGFQRKMAYSCFDFDAISFNTIDKRYAHVSGLTEMDPV